MTSGRRRRRSDDRQQRSPNDYQREARPDDGARRRLRPDGTASERRPQRAQRQRREVVPRTRRPSARSSVSSSASSAPVIRSVVVTVTPTPNLHPLAVKLMVGVDRALGFDSRFRRRSQYVTNRNPMPEQRRNASRRRPISPPSCHTQDPQDDPHRIPITESTRAAMSSREAGERDVADAARC